MRWRRASSETLPEGIDPDAVEFVKRHRGAPMAKLQGVHQASSTGAMVGASYRRVAIGPPSKTAQESERADLG